VLYRGVLLALAVALLPGLTPWRLVAVSALAFTVVHTYQGVAGMLTSFVLGGSLAVLYLGSGSLLLPVLYHVLVDLRILVLAVDRRRPRHRAARDRPATPARRRGAAAG
jgi:membrane protease YdiL (CAAX protease family)